MRTWLSKTMGNVIEMPVDAYTGIDTITGEKIYAGDTVKITFNNWRYIGNINYPQNGYKEKWQNPKNYVFDSKTYIGKIQYVKGRYGFYVTENITRFGKDTVITKFIELYKNRPYDHICKKIGRVNRLIIELV